MSCRRRSRAHTRAGLPTARGSAQHHVSPGPRPPAVGQLRDLGAAELAVGVVAHVLHVGARLREASSPQQPRALIAAPRIPLGVHEQHEPLVEAHLADGRRSRLLAVGPGRHREPHLDQPDAGRLHRDLTRPLPASRSSRRRARARGPSRRRAPAQRAPRLSPSPSCSWAWASRLAPSRTSPPAAPRLAPALST